MGLVSLLFSFHGRINRLQYWLGSIGVGVLGVFVMISMMVSTGASLVSSKNEAGALQALAAFGLVLFPVSLLMGWCGLALQVKRFHDRGRTGYLTLLPLLVMVPMVFTIFGGIASAAPVEALASSVQPYSTALWLINLGFFIDLGCLPSVDGPNKYGDPPGSPRSYAPQAPQRPTPANAGAASAASSLFGAQSAIDRAIAERARASQAPAPAQPQPQRTAPRPQPAAGGAPASFGRRTAH